MHLHNIHAGADRFSSIMRCFVGVFLYRTVVYTNRGRVHGELSYTLLKTLIAHLAFGDLFVLTFLLHVRVVHKRKKEINKTKTRIGEIKYRYDKRQTFISLFLFLCHR